MARYLIGRIGLVVAKAQLAALSGGQPVALDDVAHHHRGRADICVDHWVNPFISE